MRPSDGGNQRLNEAIERGLRSAEIPVAINMGDPPEASGPQASVLVLGDVELAGKIGGMIDRHGVDFPFAGCPADFFDADVVCLDLECCLSDKGRPTEPKPVTLAGKQHYLECLPSPARIVAHVANNHLLDYGAEAALDTIEALRKKGIECIGLEGTDVPPQPCIRQTPAGTVGFLGFSSVAHNVPGETRLRIAEPVLDRVRSSVIALRKQVDVVIVTMHQGVEYCPWPHPTDRDLCRRILLDGADLVVCHHPHVVQGIESFGEGIVFHSVGNFVSEIYDERWPEAANTFAVRTRLTNGRIHRIDIEPFAIDQRFQTVPMGPAQRQKFVAHLHALSVGLHDRATARRATAFARRFRLRSRLRYVREDVRRTGVLAAGKYYLGRLAAAMKKG